jgi:hypothetical protein
MFELEVQLYRRNLKENGRIRNHFFNRREKIREGGMTNDVQRVKATTKAVTIE